jgi:chromosome segregation ATPase
MDIDQILKQMDWLDEERRKDKDMIAKQEDRIISMQGNMESAHQQIKDLSGEITRLSAIIVRMDRFDESLLQQKVETNQQFEELEKQFKKREEEVEKIHRVEIRGVDNNLMEVRKELEPIAGIRRALDARVDEERRLARLIEEIQLKVQDIQHSEEEYSRTYRLMEDGRRQDSKRLVDLQGEVTALRKRADEHRGQAELMSANFRKLEGRLSELLNVEAERREAQSAFLDKQALQQAERESTWKEWQLRFESIENQATDMETQLQSMDETHRTTKRLKDEIDGLAQRVERRMSEITEMQRLGEERFRQEWVTFKADDQKRWTNFTLTQDEERSEIARQFEKLADRVTQIEDNLQEVQDLMQQVNEETEKRLQGLLAMTHEWVSAYERVLSHIR